MVTEIYAFSWGLYEYYFCVQALVCSVNKLNSMLSSVVF
jgi:hypothetical protein